MDGITNVVRAFWADFTRNQRLYFLFLAGPATLGVIIWAVHIAAEPRWESPAVQLDILKAVIILLALTHMVIVISMAAVRVSGRGPGGISFDVDADDRDDPTTVTAHVEGNVQVTTPAVADDGELPPDKRVKL